ncbi:Poly [ADP-ribose] polymerase 2 [Bulinus truncatus]|nr:Poly [ADP-ribose] polymerase 2 [Bulinus truncatus]
MGKTRKSTKGNVSAAAAKKAKLSLPLINNLEVRFEWEGDDSKWTCYQKSFNRSIVDAFSAGKKQVTLSLPNGVNLVVTFDKMVQKNKKTSFERRIRIALKEDKDNEFYVWSTQNKNSEWLPFSVQQSIELEKAFQENLDNVLLKSKPNSLEVDLKKMVQKNAKTNDSQPVQRFKEEVEFPANYEDETEKKADLKAIIKEEEKMDEEGEDVKLKSGKGRNKSGARSTKSSVRTLVMKKGSAPVDGLCPISSSSTVFESGKTIWDCMLNQTNISNNNNKFYLIQLLHNADKNTYHVWQRWGRVGYDGQNSLVNSPSADDAMKAFAKKFKDKTGNDWADKDSFYKIGGKYDLLKMDYSADDKDQVDAPNLKEENVEKKKMPDSKLDKKLQDLIQLICDVKSMEDAVVEMKYDAKKAPLGKLTKEQIKAGYLALQEIEKLIEKKVAGRVLAEACSDFYTRIPHEFGMQIPPLISTPQMVKEKIELLEALEDIEIAIKLLKGGDMSENPVDRHYHQLHCELEPMSHEDEEFKLLSRYLLDTHATTHNQYKMELMDVFRCDKEGEKEKFMDVGNRMLLWHGSRITNWARDAWPGVADSLSTLGGCSSHWIHVW